MTKPRGNEDYLRGYKRALVVVEKAMRDEYKRMGQELQNDYGTTGQYKGYDRAYQVLLSVVREVGPPGDD